MIKTNQNSVKKNVFITEISKSFDFFGQKSIKKKIVMFFLVLFYGITHSSNTVLRLPQYVHSLLKIFNFSGVRQEYTMPQKY